MPKESRTKTIATLGPATNSKEILRKMVNEGLDVFRLNFSHGDYAEKELIINTIRELESETDYNISILGDLQGPKIRVGRIKNEPLEFKQDDEILLTSQISQQSEKKIYVSYDNLANDIKENDLVLIDDGKIKCKCIETNQKDLVKVRVVHGGLLYSNKGVNLPQTKTSFPSLTEKDKKDVEFMLKMNLDWIALSFVRHSDDVKFLRKYAKDLSYSKIRIIAKIEKPEAVDDIDNIIETSDGIMVARGDLGVEVSFDKVPVIQKNIVEKCIKKNRPVIIATQMMESMMLNFSPTRAEANDVANAVLDGADALMLSGETSVGKYPVESIRAMESIIKYTEKTRSVYYNHHLPKINTKEFIPNSICYNACIMAEQTNAKAIISFTYSGYTAYRISGQRPKARIYAFTGNPKLLRKLPLLWGLRTFYTPYIENIDQAVEYSIKFLLDNNFIEKGDFVIHVASTPLRLKDRANMIKLSRV